MNSRPHIPRLLLVLSLMAATSGCNFPMATPTATPSAIVIVQSTNTAAPPFQGIIPKELPFKRMDQAGDVDSSANAYRKLVSGGDVFVQGLYERPFNADTMDRYFPYLDIVDTQGFRDETWGYGTITLEGLDSNSGLAAQYALELDVDLDGRGEWLIRAQNPASTEWATQGVQAWTDSDGDVGGPTVMGADSKHLGGTGYERNVFDEGKGNLIDAAWVRIKPDDTKTVEIAFKLSLIGEPASYAMGAWAGTSIDPAMFDHNDHMTHAQAGSPLPDLNVYPLKALAQIDNTCRLAIGFAPKTNISGLCFSVQHKEGECKTGACGGEPLPPPIEGPG
jgi:hypothetical protein